MTKINGFNVIFSFWSIVAVFPFAYCLVAIFAKCGKSPGNPFTRKLDVKSVDFQICPRFLAKLDRKPQHAQANDGRNAKPPSAKAAASQPGERSYLRPALQ